MIPRDLLEKLRDLVNAGKLPGLSEAKILLGTELTFREPAGRCYVKGGNDPSLNAAAIAALEAALVEMGGFDLYGPYARGAQTWAYWIGASQRFVHESRLHAAILAVVAAAEGKG